MSIDAAAVFVPPRHYLIYQLSRSSSDTAAFQLTDAHFSSTNLPMFVATPESKYNRWEACKRLRSTSDNFRVGIDRHEAVRRRRTCSESSLALLRSADTCSNITNSDSCESALAPLCITTTMQKYDNDILLLGWDDHPLTLIFRRMGLKLLCLPYPVSDADEETIVDYISRARICLYLTHRRSGEVDIAVASLLTAHAALIVAISPDKIWGENVVYTTVDSLAQTCYELTTNLRPTYDTPDHDIS